MSSQPKDLYSFLKDKGLTAQPTEETNPVASPSDSPPSGDGPNPLLNFDDDEVGERLRQASPAHLNQADFGIVRVDDDGVVEFYNTYESQLAGVEPSEAKGKNFFTQLAPCSNNRIFLGRFKKGVRTGDLDEQFTYTFTYKMRPTLVDIRLYRDGSGTNWVMVRKR